MKKTQKAGKYIYILFHIQVGIWGRREMFDDAAAVKVLIFILKIKLIVLPIELPASP